MGSQRSCKAIKLFAFSGGSLVPAYRLDRCTTMNEFGKVQELIAFPAPLCLSIPPFLLPSLLPLSLCFYFYFIKIFRSISFNH